MAANYFISYFCRSQLITANRNDGSTYKRALIESNTIYVGQFVTCDVSVLPFKNNSRNYACTMLRLSNNY